MTGKFKIWLCGAALAGAAGLSVASWAMGPAGGMGPDPARMLDHISGHLDLTDEQRAEAGRLVASAKENAATDHERMRQLRTELTGMRDNFDAARARYIADEIGQVTGRMVYGISESWAKVYQLLDARQRAELDTLIEKRGERRRKWHDHGEQGTP